jgi:hypothetical protein
MGGCASARWWSGCPAGFQGSAALSGVESDGVDTDLISGFVNGGLTGDFGGTLTSNSTMSQVEGIGGWSAGGVEELYVTCYSQQSGLGNATNVMDIYVDWSATGYSTSTSSGTTVPVGEVGGLILAGLAAIGLVIMQVRRRMRRTQPAMG